MSAKAQAAGSLGLSLDDHLAEMAGEEAAPGGGSAAAVCAAMAAALVCSVARQSREQWEDAVAMAAQAEQLRARAALLAELDARAFDQALRTLAEPGDGSPDRDARLERSLTRAAELPLEIVEIGADVTELAAQTADRCDPKVKADAIAAATLAEAASRAGATLVEVNLTTTEEDPRVDLARSLVARARISCERALGSDSV